MNELTRPTVEMISFKVQSAAIAASQWPMDHSDPQPVTGTVTVSFTAMACRSDRPLPNGDLRACEEAVREALTDTIAQFKKLQDECNSLKRKILELERDAASGTTSAG